MSTELLYALGGVALIALGLFVLVGVRHLLRRILAFNVMASGTFLVLTGMAQRNGQADPVPQALVLTGIVVAFASTALALTLLRRWFHASGRFTLDDESATDQAAAGPVPPKRSL